jgi:hypothetical protein
MYRLQKRERQHQGDHPPCDDSLQPDFEAFGGPGLMIILSALAGQAIRPRPPTAPEVGNTRQRQVDIHPFVRPKYENRAYPPDEGSGLRDRGCEPRRMAAAGAFPTFATPTLCWHGSLTIGRPSTPGAGCRSCHRWIFTVPCCSRSPPAAFSPIDTPDPCPHRGPFRRPSPLARRTTGNGSR